MLKSSIISIIIISLFGISNAEYIARVPLEINLIKFSNESNTPEITEDPWEKFAVVE